MKSSDMFLYKDGKAPRIFYARDGKILRTE